MPAKEKRRRSIRLELAMAMRVAALKIGCLENRRIAANHAKRIPVSRPENFNTGWGAMASMGRSVMKTLPDLRPEQFDEAAATLRACAHAVQHGLTTISETNLGDKRRRYGDEGLRA